MAKLVNEFSWSHSAAGEFDACRRKRYWSKYAGWGGWERDASAECRSAYRLNKMTNRSALRGVVVEESAMALWREVQAGRPADETWAWDTVAKPMLRSAWDESTGKQWLADPKKNCLHEHYYPDFCGLNEREMMVEVAEDVKLCLENFRRHAIPRLEGVTPAMEIPVRAGGRGMPEHMMFEGVRVYAIPDYVYVREGMWHIVDWKSGGPHAEHLDQIRLYALWARTQHGASAAQMRLRLEYLGLGECVEVPVTDDDLDQSAERIRESVQDMAQYLEEADIRANRPQPKEDWDLCYLPSLCRRCSFWELCRPELGDDFAQQPDDPDSLPGGG